MKADVTERFLSALAERDYEEIGRCFGSEVAFRALIPDGLRQASGAGEASALFKSWWIDSDRFRVVESTSGEVGDRVRIVYKIEGREGGAWYVCQQQAFCRVEEDRIAAIDILCSGFRPAEQPVWA